MIKSSEFDRKAERLSAVERNWVLAPLTDAVDTHRFCIKFNFRKLKQVPQILCLYEYDGTRAGAETMRSVMSKDVDLLDAEDMSTVLFVTDYVCNVFDALRFDEYNGIVMIRHGMPVVLAINGSVNGKCKADRHRLLLDKSGKMLCFDINDVYKRVNGIYRHDITFQNTKHHENATILVSFIIVIIALIFVKTAYF